MPSPQNIHVIHYMLCILPPAIIPSPSYVHISWGLTFIATIPLFSFSTIFHIFFPSLFQLPLSHILRRPTHFSLLLSPPSSPAVPSSNISPISFSVSSVLFFLALSIMSPQNNISISHYLFTAGLKNFPTLSNSLCLILLLSSLPYIY